MKHPIASIALLAFCAAAVSAKADTAPRPTDMTGAWSWERPVALRTPTGLPIGGTPTCELKQVGAKISGECSLNWAGKGPVTGVVENGQVVLNWHFILYEFALARPVISGDYNDRHADVTFRGSFDDHGVFHGRYRSDNQFGWNRAFFARQDRAAPT